MISVVAAFATGAAAIAGWFMWRLEQGRHRNTVAELRLTAGKLALFDRQLVLARTQIADLLGDAAACADPVAVRDHLDGVLQDLSPETDVDSDPLSDDSDTADFIITSELR